MGRTVMPFLRHTSRLCKRMRSLSREDTHENRFDCCALSAGADVYGLWAERVSSFHQPAATGESTGTTISWRRERITFRRFLLRGAGPWWTAIALRLLRATCAHTACGGALQHTCVPSDA